MNVYLDDPEENEQNTTVRGSSHHGLTDGVHPVHTEEEQKQLDADDENYMPTVGVVYEPNIARQTELVHNAIDKVCEKLDVKFELL